jgi:putative hemolysin
VSLLPLPLTLCLIVVAWLTAAATAVRSVSRIWLRHWVERRLRGATTAELYLDRPQRLLLAAATGVAATVYIAGILIGAVHGRTFAEAAWNVVGFALLVLVLGQLVPRAIARRWPSPLIPVLLPVLRVAELAFFPLVWIAALVTRPFAPRRVLPEDDGSEALEGLLREGELEGVGEPAEIAIISGVVQFGRKSLADVMTPREQVFALPESMPSDELARAIAHSGYSRVPIYRDTLDHIVGMVHAFDILQHPEQRAERLRPVAFARGDARCDEFLFRMLKSRLHLVVVQDAQGRTLGLATLEDLLEELVGEIRDEHDEPAVPPHVTETVPIIRERPQPPAAP